MLVAVKRLLLACVLLAGCAPPEPMMTPAPRVEHTAPAPAGERLLSLQFAPTGFTIPERATTAEIIDQVNNVTIVFATENGREGAAIAEFYRRRLPGMGFEITADGGGSMLFSDEHWQGAFTVGDSVAAISFRTDWERR